MDAHSEGGCSVCTQLVSVRKGGIPIKQAKHRGRPNATGHCGQYTLIDHINKCSSPPFYNRPDTLEFHSSPPSIHLSVTDIHCAICTNILNSPVDLSRACVLVVLLKYRSPIDVQSAISTMTLIVYI